MKSSKEIISQHYSDMAKTRHEKNPPSKDHMKKMWKKSAKVRKERKEEEGDK